MYRFKATVQITAIFLLGALCASPGSLLAEPQLKDPTAPPRTLVRGVAVAKPAEVLNLESILVGRDRRLAVINGSIVAEGDKVGSSRIVEISSDSVLVRRPGQAARLKLAATPDIRMPSDSGIDIR